MTLRKLFHPLIFVVILWIVFFVVPFLPVNPAFLGVMPRDSSGAIGILTAPLIHANLYHLISNSIPLLILGSIMYVLYKRSAPLVMMMSYILPGMFVWAIGRSALHIGASGMVYGIAFFLFSIGFVRKDFVSLLVSVVVIIFYGGMFFGIFPGAAEVSWEGHLGGALTGVLCANVFKSYKN
jgi:membrane associated rhomboid family serine protease